MEYFQAAPIASIIFIITIVTSIYGFNNVNLIDKFILRPYNISRNHQVYTLITSGFIHANWMHLIFNMMTFYFFAFKLEMMMGHWQFGILYMISLVLSDLPTVSKHKHDLWYRSLGASGAISAVLFSYILFDPLTKLIIFPLPIPIPALLFAFLYLVYCVFAARQGRDNINHDAHFYGALSGVIITLLLVPGIFQNFLQILFN